MLPSHERLEPDDLVVRQRDQRLVVQHELVALERAAQLRLELEALDGGVVHRRLEHTP